MMDRCPSLNSVDPWSYGCQNFRADIEIHLCMNPSTSVKKNLAADFVVPEHISCVGPNIGHLEPDEFIHAVNINRFLKVLEAQRVIDPGRTNRQT